MGGLRIVGGRTISFRDVCILAGAVFLAHAVVLLALRPVPYTLTVSNDLLIVAENLVAFAAIAYAAKCMKGVSRRIYTAWLIIAISQFIYVLADIAFAVIEIILRKDAFPSIADTLYLLTYPVFLVGIVLIPDVPTNPRERIKILLDMGIVIISSVLVFWNFLLAPIIEAGGQDNLSLAISLAYPVADLVLLYVVIYLLLWRTKHTVPVTLLMLRGTSIAIGDFLFTYQVLQGTYSSGSLASLGWVAGYMFSILAGVYMASQASNKTISEMDGGVPTAKRRWSAFIPLVLLLVACMLLLWSHNHRMPMDHHSITLAVGSIIGLLALRQVLTISENFRLSQSLQESLNRVEGDARALAESEARFRTLSETSPASIFIHDGIRFVYANPSMEKMTGYTEDMLKEMHFREIIAPDYKMMVNERAIARLRGESVPSRYEFKFINRSGGVRWADLTVEVVLFEGKKCLMGTAFDVDDRKKIEAQLLETNEMLRSIFASAPVSIEVIDRDSVIKMWNDASERLFGWSAQEIVGHRVPYILQEDAERFRDVIAALFRGEVLKQFEVPVIRKDGVIRTVQVSSSPIRDASGQITATVGILNDITDRRLAEEERDRQNRIIAAMAFSANTLLLSEDLDKAINEGLKALALAAEVDRINIFENEDATNGEHLMSHRYEWAKETVSSEIGNPSPPKISYEIDFPDWYDTLSSGKPITATIDDLTQRGRDLIERKGILSMLIVPIMSMGRFWGFIGFDDCSSRRTWKESDSAILQTAAAAIGGAIIRKRAALDLARAKDELEVRVAERTAELVRANQKLSQEIKERKAAEESLSLDEQRLEALLKLSQMQDAPTREASDFALEEAVRLTGSKVGYLGFLSEDESTLTTLVWSKDVMSQCAMQDKSLNFSIDKIGLLEETVRQRRPVTVNDCGKGVSCGMRIPDGHIPVKRYLNVPVFDGSKIVSLTGVANKEREYDESDIRQIGLLMEGLWRLIKQKREKDRRSAVIRELEAKNAEMERFVYTVSHDLRSPLVTVQGFMGFLKEDMELGDPVRFEKDMTMVTEAVARMDRLLDDTLELSRIGRITSPLEDVPFGDILAEALQQAQHAIRSIDAEVISTSDFPSVHVDRRRIVEVLVNLIENSAKSMGDQPHPRIEIGFRIDAGETVFFVKDNGIGIDPSQHEKVFDLFYKVQRNSKGTGVGLAIVKRIIDVHGGRIWIESELGKGCTVCLTLPLARTEGR